MRFLKFLEISAQILIFSLVLLVTSVYLYTSIKSSILPRHGIIKEQIYFDFNSSMPFAKVYLLKSEKQWDYEVSDSNILARKLQRKDLRFFRHGLDYNIYVDLIVPCSTRNLQLLKFMIYIKALSIDGTVLAKSSRPVVLPYESAISRTLNTLTKWPLYLIGNFTIFI